MPAAKKPKHPSTTRDKVDAYYTHTETEGASLEDIALDAVLRSEARTTPSELWDPSHYLNVLESLFIENTLGSTPDAKAIVFFKQLFVLSDALASQITSSFAFKAPLKVAFVGRSAIGSGSGIGHVTSPKLTVDVAVDMPGSCFDDKDYLNHRYHAKRVLYLDCLRRALLGKMRGAAKGRDRGAHGRKRGHVGTTEPVAEVKRVAWATTLVDPRKPYLCLEIDGAPGVEFRVHTSLEQRRGTWLKKLRPDAGNLRACMTSEGGKASTPMYNHSIVEDLIMLSHAEASAKTASRFPIFDDVVSLLEIWARNHGLSASEDRRASSLQDSGDSRGLDTGFFAALVSLVLRGDDQMQYSTQRMHVFRGALQFLCGAETRFVRPSSEAKKWGVFSSDSAKTPATQIKHLPEPPARNVWRAAFKDGVLFVSHLMGPYANVAARVSRDVLQQARKAAEAASRMLVSAPMPDAIDAIFMKKSNPVMLYDMWCSCDVLGDGAAATSTISISGDVSDRVLVEARVHQVASEALGDRATLVRVLHSPYTVATNADGAIIAVYSSRTSVQLCCRLHAMKSMRSVDIGPAADDAHAASEFRAFWGAKSELRRFQDGKICESVVWSSGVSDGGTNRLGVVRQLLNYIIPYHCPEVTGVEVPAMELSRALWGSAVITVTPESSDLYERACLDGMTKLGKTLRGLGSESVTLTIVNVQPVDAVLRNVAIFPPVPHQLAGSSLADASDMVPRCLPAIEVLCQLEGSGKWPDAPVAYAKMKAALGVQLARTLNSSYGIDAIASEHYVDVLFEGFAYRLILFSERESPDAMAHIGLRQAHQGLISSLAAEHPSFKLCCRLAKLWIARQHLSNHICEEATELVCAAAYTTKISIGAACPSSPEAGFLSFLDIMAYHPWEAQPLVLDTKVVDDAARLMSRMRAIGKAPSMFVVMGSAGSGIGVADNTSTSSKKLQCVAWTEKAPDNVILFRASALARKAIKAIVSELTAEADASSKTPISSRVFNHSMNDYDIVVVLRRDALVGGGKRGADDMLVKKDHQMVATYPGSTGVDASIAKNCQAVLSGIPKSLVKQRGAKIKKELLIGFDPLPLFCELLREQYQHVAIVCANLVDGNQIGIKIKPAFCKPEGVAFDADYGCSVFRPLSSDGSSDMVTVSAEAFAQDIMELGSGIVESVLY